jgi:hypothetical protein
MFSIGSGPSSSLSRNILKDPRLAERIDTMKSKTKWAKEPEKEDYSAAQTYLSLIYDKKEAAKLLKKLRAGETCNFEAKVAPLACLSSRRPIRR